MCLWSVFGRAGMCQARTSDARQRDRQWQLASRSVLGTLPRPVRAYSIFKLLLHDASSTVIVLSQR